MKAALDVLGRNKSPGVDGILRIISSHKDWIYQNPNKNTSANVGNKTMAYRMEMIDIHPNPQ